MQSNLKASLKFALLVLWIGLFFPPVWLARALGNLPLRDRLVRRCNEGILAIAGIRLKVVGQMADVRPLLLVANHISYLDVPILSSLGHIRHTPKSDMRGWPVLSTICHLCDCVFIDRSPDKVAEVKQELREALEKGERLCLFAEGTTGNGLRLEPFKSSFLSLAEEKVAQQEVAVQPVAVTYTRIRSLPIDTTQWPLIAWTGDMELWPHLWEFLKLGPIDAEVTFLPVATLQEKGDRKRLARYCQDRIAQAIEEIRARRREEPRKQINFQPKFMRIKQ